MATVLATVGLRLSEEKTLITHIDEGLDVLGWRIQRHQKRGTDRHYVYNYPAKKALRSIKAKTKTICRMNVAEAASPRTESPLATRRITRADGAALYRAWTRYLRLGPIPVGSRNRGLSQLRDPAILAKLQSTTPQRSMRRGAVRGKGRQGISLSFGAGVY